jgi:LmbE family N-acetylglucosaminyl deacetylase
MARGTAYSERAIGARVRRAARAAYRGAIGYAAAARAAVPTACSAVVFSPHPDDETLACGGTIALKRRLGAAVTIVEMTSGEAAYGDARDGERLKTTRRAEAVAASEVLGVQEDDLIFLAYPDGRLGDFVEQATARVRTIIEGIGPRELFVPYAHDGHPDHEATSAIVHAAVRHTADPAAFVVYEYPVWFLHHWPLVEGPVLSTLRWNAARAVRIFRDFRTTSDVREVLEVKRNALAHHRSQLAGRASNSAWRSLAELSNGDFLELFLGDFELFHRVQASCHRPPVDPTRR